MFPSNQTSYKTPHIRSRISVALLIAAVTGWLSWAAQSAPGTLSRPGGDLLWALVAATDLRAGRDPYGHPFGPEWTPYPLPAALIGLPFSFLPFSLAGGLFFGLSCGLLAFCIAKNGYGRLWIYLATPFWFCLFWAQWSPLIMAAAFIPALLPVVLIKPHIALPVVLTHPTRIGVYCCVAVGLLSLVIYPRWPLVWLSQLGQFQRFFPVTMIPVGPLLLLALLRWRDKDAQLLLLASLLPQRHFYDSFVLWLIPKNWKESLPTALVSFGAWIWKAHRGEMKSPEVGLVSVLFFFLPILCVILLRPSSRLPRDAQSQLTTQVDS